jgi:hypothetical protein
MFHRIEVNVIDMARKIGIVAKRVLPVAPLPYSLFASGDFAAASIWITGQAAGEIMLDQAPAPRKVGVVLRERPNRVQVIGQNTDGDRFEWIALVRRRVGCAKPPDVPYKEVTGAVGESQSEKEPSAFNPNSQVP